MHIIAEKEVDTTQLVQDLRAGKTIVYPTETCYGLGCDAYNQSAVDHIYAIKKRQRSKSLLVVFPDIAMIANHVQWTPMLQRLTDTYWPGPLTIVAPLKGRNGLADGVVAEDNTIAFRVSSHPFVSSITTAFGGPLVSTSANIAQQESPYDIDSVIEMFSMESSQPDVVIDGGQLATQSPSTIVRVEGDKFFVIRQGSLVVT